MLTNGNTYRNFREIPLSEKYRFPVSSILSKNSEILIVSFYSDIVWDFYPYIPQENIKPGSKVINWTVLLPDGLNLTSPKHAMLLDSTKDFIWSLFCDPVDGRKRPSMLTLIAKFELILPLIRWMVSLGLNQFSQIDGKTLNYLPIAQLSQTSGKLVSESTFHYRLHILEYIYKQRNKINDALSIHPWPNETALSLSGVKRTIDYRKPSTEYISDDIANKIALTAIDYIQNKFSKLEKAMQRIYLAGNNDTLTRRQSKVDARTRAAKAEGFSGILEIKKQMAYIRTSCYIIIDMFSGIRDSEMMSLETNCVTRNKSIDEITEIIWLHGTIYKTGLRKKKWVIPEIVVSAIEVLSKTTESYRNKLEEEKKILEGILKTCKNMSEIKILNKRLHTVKNQHNKLFLSVATKFSNEISVLSGKQMGVDLKEFCSAHGISTNDGKPYLLHAHQFRRTYARFLARAELGDLLTLRDHFGHASLDMTTYYTEGATDDYEVDIELIEMVIEEKDKRQNEILHSYLTSDTPLANGMHWLSDWRATVRTAPNKEKLISEYAGMLTLNGTGHSWCVGNAKGVGCGGLCVFEAQLCVDCHYGIIGPEHRPIWNGIRDQQIEALGLDDIGPGGRARTIEILKYAEKVLMRLDGKEAE